MRSLGCEEASPHLIRRDELYNDGNSSANLWKSIYSMITFRVAFDDEQALDTGGVSRDLFSAFWNIACQKLFDGSGTFIPAIHPHMDMQVFPLLGRILSFSWVFSLCFFTSASGISNPFLCSLGPNV